MAESEITIYERGSPEVQKRIDPALLQAITFDDMLVALNRVNQHLEKAEFKGEVDPRVLAVTATIGELKLEENWPFTPWITASFFNDGPNTAYIAINRFFAEWIELRTGEGITIDFAKSDKRIRFINHRCNVGNTASVRVVGKY